ncbi:MAG TPA: FGLLP motif-containing membrane protein [Acidimicrobiales bacterium]|nr:FGLLP motif-containing membrane protein [Acidimicrobiales bacterium]
MRRLVALMSLLSIGALGCALAVAALLAGSARAASLQSAAGCQPVITSFTSFKAGPYPQFTLSGSCFGTGGTILRSDSPHFGVVVFPPGTSLGQMKSVVGGSDVPQLLHWSACSDIAGQPYVGPNGVNCNITSWTGTEITLSAFAGGDANIPSFQGYPHTFNYDYLMKKGDKVAVQVWNAQTGAGPATVYLTAGGPGSSVVSSLVSLNSRVSSIGSSLPTPARAFRSVSSDAIDLVITLGIALFITFPANLFNSTFQENYEDIVSWWGKWARRLFPPPLRRAVKSGLGKLKAFLLARLKLAGRSRAKRLQRENAIFAVVLVGGSLLGAMLDPSFGANFRTVLSFVSIVLALFAGVAISGLVTGTYHRARKHGRVAYKLEALPIGLLVAAFCVIVSRATGFRPGYLYGVIAGVSFARPLAKHEEGHVVALGSWLKVAIAVLAWALWAAITHDAGKRGSFFGLVLVDDFLASLFVSSMVGQLISLLPLKFMPGHKLQAWHKGAWAVTFLVTLFVVVQVLLRPGSTASGPSHAPLVTTVVLFVLFGVGSVLFADHFARKRRHLAASGGAAVITLEEAVDLEAEHDGVPGNALPGSTPAEAAGPAPERP